MSSRSLGNIIADSLQLSVGYAERLLRDVPADQAARFARVGGVAIESNHPAFIYGHLSLYAPKVLWQLSAPAPTIPEYFENLFSKDASCRDEPDLYPPFEEITAFFFEGHRMLAGALRSTPNDTFDKPNPAGGKMAERFPTLGSVQTFYCGGHIMMHLGQMSAWRRMMGLGNA
jgi:hypothetical protein